MRRTTRGDVRQWVLALLLVVTPLVLAEETPPAEVWSIEAITDGTRASRTPPWSPDGRRIAFDVDVGGRWQVHTLDMSLRATTPLPLDDLNARHPAWAPDGREVALVGGPAGATLLAWRLAARRARQLAALPGPASFPSWSPDGRTIAVTVRQGETFTTWMVPVDGAPPTRMAIGVGPRRLAPLRRRRPSARLLQSPCASPRGRRDLRR